MSTVSHCVIVPDQRSFLFPLYAIELAPMLEPEVVGSGRTLQLAIELFRIVHHSVY